MKPIILSDFYTEIKNKWHGSESFPTLHKLGKAVARLKLKEIADKDDTKEGM